MKPIFKITFSFLVLIIPFLTASAQKVPFKKFSFLIGNWEMKTKNGKITEHWKSDSKTYIGSSYKHNIKGDSTLTESIVIKQIHGAWFFCVTGYETNNTGTTNFRLISTKKGTLIFENLTHDFPQRIVYQPKGKDSLLAWIEGKIEGKNQKIDFAYQRKK